MPEWILWLVALIPVAFVQNAVFTLVSRSRNSGDPRYHFKAALASNSVWLVCQVFVWKGFWSFFSTGDIWPMVAMGVVYTLSTTAGSVWMMKANLGHYKSPLLNFLAEKGQKLVGSR